MDKKVGKKHRSLKTWVRVVIVAILVFTMFLSIYLIYTGKNPNEEKIKGYVYDIDENIEYKVYLKENDFFEEEYLTEGKQYTTQVIDYVDIDFKYTYSGSANALNNYRYQIIGTLKGEYENTDNGNAELWKKNYVLLDTKEINTTDAGFTVNQNVKIDYSKYSRIVDNFKTKFKIAIDAYMDVKLLVVYENKLAGTSSVVSGSDAMSVKIPLSKATIKIDKQLEEHRSKKLTEENLLKPNSLKIKTGMILGGISLIIFILVSPKVFASKKTLYVRKKEKIMKSYSEILVTTDTLPDLQEMEILTINDFDDMVDLEEELKSPILVYEPYENKECWFIVINDKYAYRYVLNSKNL